MERFIVKKLESISINITSMKLRKRFRTRGEWESDKKRIQGLIYCLLSFFRLKN